MSIEPESVLQIETASQLRALVLVVPYGQPLYQLRASRVHRPGPAGRSLAASLPPEAASSYPTPLMYLWPPGPDASPDLGAAHGLMGRWAGPGNLSM